MENFKFAAKNNAAQLDAKRSHGIEIRLKLGIIGNWKLLYFMLKPKVMNFDKKTFILLNENFLCCLLVPEFPDMHNCDSPKST